MEIRFRIRNDGLFTGTADIIIVSCEYIIAGDLDGDCKVNLADLTIIAANWLTDCNIDSTDAGCIPKSH